MTQVDFVTVIMMEQTRLSWSDSPRCEDVVAISILHFENIEVFGPAAIDYIPTSFREVSIISDVICAKDALQKNQKLK